MACEITTGTILIKDNALLPKGLQLESEACVPGWRLVKVFDGYSLDQELRKMGWTFFCLAGELEATVFGIEKEKMVRRAIVRILANPKSEIFNFLEITRVCSAGSDRFPLVHYVTVSAHSRHIQESLILCRAKDLSKLEIVPSEPSSQTTRIESGQTPPLQEPAKSSSVGSIFRQ